MRVMLKGILAVAVLTCVASAWAIANDDADNPPYADNVWDLTDNGGFGFGNWYELPSEGGGRFIATAPFQVLDGSRSWGLYAGDGAYAIARPLQDSRDRGQFSVLARHNVNNEVGFTGVAVLTYGDVELIRFGLDPSTGDTAVYVQYGTNTASINLGTELRGQRLKYTLDWNASGAFTLSVNRLDGSENGSFSGNWGSGSIVRAFGFINNNSGDYQDLIFDQMDVVPEPASLLALGAGLAGLMGLRRRRTA